MLSAKLKCWRWSRNVSQAKFEWTSCWLFRRGVRTRIRNALFYERESEQGSLPKVWHRHLSDACILPAESLISVQRSLLCMSFNTSNEKLPRWFVCWQLVWQGDIFRRLVVNWTFHRAIQGRHCETPWNLGLYKYRLCQEAGNRISKIVSRLARAEKLSNLDRFPVILLETLSFPVKVRQAPMRMYIGVEAWVRANEEYYEAGSFSHFWWQRACYLPLLPLLPLFSVPNPRSKPCWLPHPMPFTLRPSMDLANHGSRKNPQELRDRRQLFHRLPRLILLHMLGLIQTEKEITARVGQPGYQPPGYQMEPPTRVAGTEWKQERREQKGAWRRKHV